YIAMRSQHLLQTVEQFLPSGILFFRAGQGVQMSRLDLVNQLDGFALGGDQVVPPPRDHESIWQPENAVRDRVAMVMIVEKPGVDVALAQGLLNGGQVHIKRLFYTTAGVTGFLARARHAWSNRNHGHLYCGLTGDITNVV